MNQKNNNPKEYELIDDPVRFINSRKEDDNKHLAVDEWCGPSPACSHRPPSASSLTFGELCDISPDIKSLYFDANVFIVTPEPLFHINAAKRFVRNTNIFRLTNLLRRE